MVNDGDCLGYLLRAGEEEQMPEIDAIVLGSGFKAMVLFYVEVGSMIFGRREETKNQVLMRMVTEKKAVFVFV